jgi:hypothetical protein
MYNYKANYNYKVNYNYTRKCITIQIILGTV